MAVAVAVAVAVVAVAGGRGSGSGSGSGSGRGSGRSSSCRSSRSGSGQWQWRCLRKTSICLSWLSDRIDLAEPLCIRESLRRSRLSSLTACQPEDRSGSTGRESFMTCFGKSIQLWSSERCEVLKLSFTWTMKGQTFLHSPFADHSFADTASSRVSETRAAFSDACVVRCVHVFEHCG